MADHARRDQESMYCHACHHQWQRASESIECPVCMSASTEIVCPENDPRQFHNRLQETAPATEATATPAVPEPAPNQNADADSPRNDNPNPADAANPESGNSQRDSDGHGPRVTIRVTTAELPPITFFTFVTGPVPPPPPENSPPPVTLFGMRFFPPFPVIPVAPPPTVNTSPNAEAADHSSTEQQQNVQQQGTSPESQQQQPNGTEQQPQQPHPANTPHTHTLLASLLHSLFHASTGAPAGGFPTFFNPADAVYTQQAFDRILTHLREQTAPGGAPPASQAALDRLQARAMREVDDAMLDGKMRGGSKCVICVDEMVKGEKAAVLPCEHWFHGECVVPWLKVHGTCPVCRRSVEVEEEGEGEAGKVGKGDHNDESEVQRDEGRGEEAGAMDCS